MPVVRAIRTMTGRFAELRPKFMSIMMKELDEAIELGIQADGTKCWGGSISKLY